MTGSLLKNTGSSTCLHVDTVTKYPTGGHAINLVACDASSAGQQWKWMSQKQISSSHSSMCLEHNPWGQVGVPDAWELGAMPDRRNTFVYPPQTPNMWQPQYLEFLNKYGAHYATGVDMGARMAMYDKVQYEAYRKATAQGTSIFASASLKFTKATVGVSGMSQKQQQQESSYESLVSSSSQYFVGAKQMDPSLPLSAWENEIAQDPLPMQIQSRLIYELLTPQLFPQLTHINNVALRMQQAVASWCGTLPGCQDAAADPNPDITPCPIDATGAECSNHGTCGPGGQCACAADPGTSPVWKDPSVCSVDCSPVPFRNPSVNGVAIDSSYDTSTFCTATDGYTGSQDPVQGSADQTVKLDGTIINPWSCGFLWLDTCYPTSIRYLECIPGPKQLCNA